MKKPLAPDKLPDDALMIACSSHEGRCLGLVNSMEDWSPAGAIVFHYDDPNPRREVNHKTLRELLKQKSVPTRELMFTESSAARSLHDNMDELNGVLAEHGGGSIILDISVFTKRHLLMMLRWLDDIGCWDRLTLVYTEPEEDHVSEFIPLSFGLRGIIQIPGFAATPDLSRPLHLVLFLGYEGDRALAAYENIQPMQTTVVITDPPYRPDWKGRSENLNRDLLALTNIGSRLTADGIDPLETKTVLKKIFDDNNARSEFSKIICPLGTKPQTAGIYSYVRDSADPPSVVYASPLRHNHRFFSHGIGNSWILNDK